MTRAVVGARVSVMTPGKTYQDEQYLTGERYVQQQYSDLVDSFETSTCPLWILTRGSGRT
jgi:hypothetical protein